MNTSETANKNQKPVTAQFKDVSRFTRFISRMDDNDKQLAPQKRRPKWIVVLSGFFLLFLVSFLFPVPELSHKKLDAQEPSLPEDPAMSVAPNTNEQKSLTFEMPVDSFEALLKQRIHESNPEKK